MPEPDLHDVSARLAVQEDRMERVHLDNQETRHESQREIREIRKDIKEVFRLIREHMKKEEEDRAKESETRNSQYMEMIGHMTRLEATMNKKIAGVEHKGDLRWRYVAGIAAAVSVFWVAGIMLARIGGLI